MTEVEKIQKLIDESNDLLKDGIDTSDPRFDAWRTKVLRFLAGKFREDSIECRAFRNRIFHSPIYHKGQSSKSTIMYESIKATILELEEYKEESEGSEITMPEIDNLKIDKVFIVHGHDGELKQSVARIIEKQGIEAIILSEQANRGRTVIEKIEENTDIRAGVVLLTCDDIGKEKNESDENPRARQNVIFECGFLMGKIKRENVVVVAEDGIEIPSDLNGVVYCDKADWKTDLVRELKAIGFKVDANKLL